MSATAAPDSRPIMKPSAMLADTAAAASVGAATVAGYTLNEWAALTAIIAGVLSIADRLGILPKFGPKTPPAA